MLATRFRAPYFHPMDGFHKHEHKACVNTAMTRAEDVCAADGLRLTPLRRRVLEILLESHRALGAYDVLDRLRAEGLGSQPPVAYRALDFWVGTGLVHKVERLNAFLACSQSHADNDPILMICNHCDAIAETTQPKANSATQRAAKDAGFQIESITREVTGTCPNCLGTTT